MLESSVGLFAFNPTPEQPQGIVECALSDFARWEIHFDTDAEGCLELFGLVKAWLSRKRTIDKSHICALVSAQGETIVPVEAERNGAEKVNVNAQLWYNTQGWTLNIMFHIKGCSRVSFGDRIIAFAL